MNRISDGLYLVDLDLPREGFRKFISSWIVRGGGGTVVMDPGPASTYHFLRGALDELGVSKIDLLLLTHVHIDHAGAAGHLVSDFPGTRVHCHRRGIAHVTDPSRLWEGSRKVLGRLAEEYGPIPPVPPELIMTDPPAEACGMPLREYETPGHAAHHVSYEIGNLLFAGEAAGIYLDTGSGFYLRPATPPVFDYGSFRSSLELIEKSEAETLCFGHYGYSNSPAAVFTAAREQMDLWMRIIGERMDTGKPFDPVLVRDELCAVDPVLTGLNELPGDIRARELHFMLNSIKGIQGYLEGTRR